MTIIRQKPAYQITVRDNFWNFLLAEDMPARMYENEIYREPTVKSVGLKKNVTSSEIRSSGIVYDVSQQVYGGEIALDSVALSRALLDKASGAAISGGFAYDNTSDKPGEFGFGYYLDESDGNKVYYWHPRCVLVPSDEKAEDIGNNAVDPTASYTIKCMPTSEGYWRVRYYTRDENMPLTVAQFFAFCRYTESVQAASLSIGDTVTVDTPVTATVAYADGIVPVSPTVSYQWYSDYGGEFAPIARATSASYTPEAAGESIYCEAKISGSAVGWVRSATKVVAAA